MQNIAIKKPILVSIMHAASLRYPDEVPKSTVAVYVIPEPDKAKELPLILEDVYVKTQNIHDSWSLPIEGKRDGHPNIKVEAPFPRHNVSGEKMGHRSTSVGDLLRVQFSDGQFESWRVCEIGFELRGEGSR